MLSARDPHPIRTRPRRRPSARRLAITAVAGWLGLGAASGHAQSDSFRQQLDTIANYAERICDDIPIRGSGENVELSGEARAELSGILDRLVDLGLAGGGRYRTEEYQGLLQKDLAAALADSRDCKREIHNTLTERLLFADPANGASAAPPTGREPRSSSVAPTPTPATPAFGAFGAFAYCSQTGVTGYARGAASPQAAMAAAVDDCIYRGGVPSCCTAGASLAPLQAQPQPPVGFAATAYCSRTGAVGQAQGLPTPQMAMALAVDDCIGRGGIPDCCAAGVSLAR